LWAKARAEGMAQANPAVLVAFRNDLRFMRSPETLVFPVRELCCGRGRNITEPF
jgi:hypothetical protein